MRQREGERKRDRTITKPRKNVKEIKKRVLLIFCNVQVLRNNFIKICPLQERKLQVRTGGKSLGIRLYVSLVELEVVK